MEQLNQYIDHTLLKPDANEADIHKLCREAIAFQTASVCVNSCWVDTVHRLLAGSGIKTCVVAGFPLGAASSEVKAFEAAYAVSHGADEVDMVLNIGWVKSGRWEDVRQDISAVVCAAAPAAVKVILETCLLTPAEIRRACLAAGEAGASYVKTSTGFSTNGATVQDVALMRDAVGGTMGIKASGGIHSRKEAEAMIEAGATRIGCSATAEILAGV